MLDDVDIELILESREMPVANAALDPPTIFLSAFTSAYFASAISCSDGIAI